MSVAALTLSSCAGKETAADGAGKEPAIGSVEKMSSTEGLEFPVAAYEVTSDQQYQVKKAQNLLIEQCMKRFGFDYALPAPTPPSRNDSKSRVFGLASAKDAAQFGYASPSQATDPAPAKRQSPAALSRTGQTVLNGVDPVAEAAAKAKGKAAAPTDEPMSQAEAAKAPGSGIIVNGKEVPVGGCGRESALKLYSPKPGSVDILFVFNLGGEAESRALEDSRVRKATTKWSQCMADSGFTTSSPDSVQSDLGLKEGALSSPEAITIAKADVACKTQANYIGIRYAVQSAYEKRLVEEHAETLALFQQQTQDRLRLAAQLNG
ncbi:hypothetical protein [Streptomyces sp. RKAG290]|uniref:hypothetical protein n=1 Tax=Streptomyces sp. RKAG290 TaxID=2888348 RepID=UPI00203467C9|nr:hypothetical protein [Streptomyces sp. RKAG290]MCM2412776.1 hypothetical protein [Streptomyces sp. RKAG290]